MTLNYLADVDHAAVGDHLLHAAPMSHGSGLYAIPNIAAGATQLIPAARGFDLDEIRQMLACTPSVKFFAAPTMVMRLVDAIGSEGAPANLKSIIYGGGPMYVADSLRALDVLRPAAGPDLRPGRIADDDHRAPGRASTSTITTDAGSIGSARSGARRPASNSLCSTRTTGRSGPGEIGEVCVRGDVVMAGYLNNPQATAAALANGWLHTGDLGRLDEHGYLTLVDRSKDLIISGGSNIYPREVEEVLLLHPAIKEAAVVGVPDPEWGEAVVAVVVRKEGHIPDEKELDLFCLEHIARFKRPKRYVFVDELPKNATGKVLKRELRERFRTEPPAVAATGAPDRRRLRLLLDRVEQRFVRRQFLGRRAVTTISWLMSTGPKFASRLSSASTSMTRLSWPRVIARNTSASSPASSNAPCKVRCAFETP